jgi:YHS domain-containing protein
MSILQRAKPSQLCIIKMNNKMKSFLTTLLAAFIMASAFSQTTRFNNQNGIAIKGYDPVAYFIQNKAVAGMDAYTFEWSGSQWKFSSQTNLDSFKKAPEKYAPQYGGYCAYGCSENYKAPIDPEAFTILNNKLYLNYSMKVKTGWLKDTTARIKAADANWPALNQ